MKALIPLSILLAPILAPSISCRPADKGPSSHEASPLSGEVASGVCDTDTSAGVLISRYCIGPIPVDSPLGVLAARFPGSRPGTESLETTPIPTLEFNVGGVTAIAAQVRDSIDPKSPAWKWMVSGPSALLSKDVHLPRTWGELRVHFGGRGVAHMDELGAHAELCELPGLTFFLDFDYSAVNADSILAAEVPAEATITGIGLYPADTTSVCP